MDFDGRHQPPVEALTGVTLWLSALVLGWVTDHHAPRPLVPWWPPNSTSVTLKTFCWVLTVLLLVRATAVVVGMIVAERAADPANWSALVSASGWGMFLWVRILWGLVGGAIAVGHGTSLRSRRGSNQSATGILYVVVVSVWIGEATALFLQAMTGVAV